MKFNWGTGIALFYSLFVVALVFQVFKSTQYDNSLVSDHYYADDLNYQEHYNKLRNSQQLDQDLVILNMIQKEQLELQFPEEPGKASGKIHFFCPSDSKRDFNVTIDPDENNLQSISTADLKQGLWKIKVDWNAGGRAFYKEEAVNIHSKRS